MPRNKIIKSTKDQREREMKDEEQEPQSGYMMQKQGPLFIKKT